MLFFSEETFIAILFMIYLLVVYMHRSISAEGEFALNFSLEIDSLSLIPVEVGSFYNYCSEVVDRNWMDFVRDAPVYKRVKYGPINSDEIDWDYISWFLAGDGSISMYVKRKGGQTYHYWHVSFTQSRVNVSVLERIGDFLATKLSRRYDARPTSSWNKDKSDYQVGPAQSLNRFRLQVTRSEDIEVIASVLVNCPNERKAKIARLFLEWYKGDRKDGSWLVRYKAILSDITSTNARLLEESIFSESGNVISNSAWEARARQAIENRKISTNGICGLLESDMCFRAGSKGRYVYLGLSCNSVLYDGEMCFILKNLFGKGSVSVSSQGSILSWRVDDQDWIEEYFVRRIMLASVGPLGFRNLIRYCVFLDLRSRGSFGENPSQESLLKCEETLLRLRTSIFGDTRLKINPSAPGVPKKVRSQLPSDWDNPNNNTITHIRWLITVIGDPTLADWPEPLKNPWQDNKVMESYQKRFKHDL
tara:strand:- start:44 stop:1474 length:1431 start_codon:yes stop_codon:yes gene_type:complete